MEGIFIYSAGSLIVLLSLLQTEIPREYLATVAVIHAIVLFIVAFTYSMFIGIKQVSGEK